MKHSRQTESLESLNRQTAIGSDSSNQISVARLLEPGSDAIGFNACTFSWDPFTEGPHQKGRRQFFLKFDDEVRFVRGTMNLIVGPTGSGKVRNHYLYMT